VPGGADERPIAQSRAFDRARVRAVQTPQGFSYPVLLAAHAEPHPEATDDLVVVEAAGHPVTLVAGDERAFKITTPADLDRARALVEAGGFVPDVTSRRLTSQDDDHQGRIVS